ncbi:MAG: TetR family transcriptional regulator [Microthrixaceae bacterium]
MTLTKPQQDRRERMLHVATRLAVEGGFDAVQMRAVANEAEVALGTLYRYFPSKEHLLVSALRQQIQALEQRLAVRPAVGGDEAARVIDVLTRANRALQRQHRFAVAVIRSLAAGDETVAPVVREVRDLMGGIIVAAIDPSGSTDGRSLGVRERLVAEVLEEVWLSSLVAWIGGVDGQASVDRKLADATMLMLGPR